MFTLIHGDHLSKRHFEQHPAWANYEEPNNIEQIVSWGVERAAVVAELERVKYSDEFIFPVLRTHPLLDFRLLYLKAEFTAADGSQFAGYVIGAPILRRNFPWPRHVPLQRQSRRHGPGGDCAVAASPAASTHTVLSAALLHDVSASRRREDRGRV
jgi:hypothetical protein